jgi:hypothetical protein
MVPFERQSGQRTGAVAVPTVCPLDRFVEKLITRLKD